MNNVVSSKNATSDSSKHADVAALKNTFELPEAIPADSSRALFRSTTIAPSPPPNSNVATSAAEHSNRLHLDTTSRLLPIDIQASSPSPLSAGLRIQTDIVPGYTITAATNNNTARSSSDLTRLPHKSQSIEFPLARTPSIKNVFASSIGSNSNLSSAPNSALSSPMLSAMAE